MADDRVHQLPRVALNMKQLLQNMRDGKALVLDVPIPHVQPGTALVRTAASLVSVGTERMVIEFAEKSLVAKARSRPDLVLQVVDKARREGILPTIKAAFNRLDQPLALGYSSSGTIIALGKGLEGYKVGDRVACAGSGYAVHAEYAIVPKNLLTPLPPEVDFETAAFSTLGAIALQGFRLAEAQIGENVAVIGLGLLGLLSVAIAHAAGCRVFGIDLDPLRAALGEQFGAKTTTRAQAESAGMSFTKDNGFDTVLICAATSSNDPVELAGQIARDQGKVVAVGAVGMDIPRRVYFDKELSFQVSRSYGPGRYDPNYEEKGQDYPIGYVRWTEGRNLDAFVNLLATKQIDVTPLITHRFPIDDSPQAYDLITGKGSEPFLGILLTYALSESRAMEKEIKLDIAHKVSNIRGELSLGVLGAGNYARAVFLPVIKKAGGIHPKGIVSASGLNASHAAKKYGYEFVSSSNLDILENPEIDIVVILTRHQHHAHQVQVALRHGKHVYCEKPLALNKQELEQITSALASESAQLLMVGYNRRFAPLTQKLKGFFEGRGEPMFIQYRVNAGYLPETHWLHDPKQGGGRIIGEGCHFVDFLTHLVGTLPANVIAQGLPDAGRYHSDNLLLTYTFPDGSLGSISYLANGDKSVAKERLEIFCEGKVAILDDFRNLELVFQGQRKKNKSPLGQDKGHQNAWEAFLHSVQNGGPPPIPYDEMIGVSLATFAANDSLRLNEQVSIDL